MIFGLQHWNSKIFKGITVENTLWLRSSLTPAVLAVKIQLQTAMHYGIDVDPQIFYVLLYVAYYL